MLRVCIPFGIMVIGGITYGIILALRPYFSKAIPVDPPYNESSYNESSHLLHVLFFKYHDNSTTEYYTSHMDGHEHLKLAGGNPNASMQLKEEPFSGINTSAVSAFPKPRKEVPPQCADPTFACQDLENARLCDVVKSCVHDIWATMSAPDDNDEICDICKEMVKEARDQLLSNMTQEEIKEVFEGSCKLLPVKLVADACIKIVDEIIPELVEMLASRMDPNMVCTVSGLCNMAHLPVENYILKFLRMVLTPHKDSQCDQCTKMMTDVKTFLKSETEADVEKYIEKFCDKEAPSYLCDILVDDYFPKIYSYIVSTDAKTLCNSVGICAQKCELIEDKPSHLKDELTCEFCEHVLQHIKDLITANTTAEEFKTALLNFCKHTGKFSDKCTALVNDYYDMLFDYIKKLDTKGMCTLMQLCNNEKCSKVPLVKVVPSVESRKQMPLIKLRPAEALSKGIEVYPLVRLIPADVLSKKQLVESNEIFRMIYY